MFPVYLLLVLVWANRYFFGLYLKLGKGRRFDRTISGYEPTVTIVTPLYNEGRSIYRSILSFLEQDYPAGKLRVCVVDDCSTDDSYQWACRAAAEHPNVEVLRNPRNVGKRMSIHHAVRRSPSEIIVSVDSDVVLDPQAVRQLVARFTAPEIAAVGGRVNVSNANQNWLTRMQTIKYFFGYEYLKNLERAMHSVMCLSGCLTAYRRSVLIELEPILENRNVLGVPIKYGEDRFLTRQIVKAGHETVSTLEAVCYTKVPSTLGAYFAQQLRWRRSNLIDFFCGTSHAWKLHPLVAIHYLSLFAMLLLYPMAIYEKLRSGSLYQLAMLNLAVLATFGMLYRWQTRDVPAPLRVHPIWFLPMAVLMPVTYLLFTPLALFTLHSSSWETRGTGRAAPEAPSTLESEGPDGLRAADTSNSGGALLAGGELTMSLANIAQSAQQAAPAPELDLELDVDESTAMIPRTRPPRRINLPPWNQLIVGAYKMIGFAILTVILFGLVSYIANNLFYFLNSSWVSPTVIAPTDEHVLQLNARLAEQASLRDKLVAERAAMEASLDDLNRVIAMQTQFQERFKVAVAADLSDRRSQLDRLRGLANDYLGAKEEIGRSNRAYAGLSRKRMEELRRAHLLDVDGYVNGNYQLSQLAHSNLELAEKEVELNSKSHALSREAEALDAVSDGSAGGLSYDALRIQAESYRSMLELKKAIGSRDALREGIASTDRSIARYDRILKTIRDSPFVRASEGSITLALAPYGNLANVKKGAPLYACALGFLWCREVGSVVEALSGEMPVKHPIHNSQLRGLAMRVELTDARAAESAVLFAGGAPLLR